MVEKSALTAKIDSRLRSLRSRLEALPWYAERYGSAPIADEKRDANIDALLYEWHDTLDRFEGAHEWYLAGQMSAEQAHRHRANLALLANQTPVIRQLGLAMPGDDLLAAAKSQPPDPARARPA
jgi:hypothetical protein